MKRINEAAALHLAAGAVKGGEVPVGIHDLSRVRVLLTFPEGASVQRVAGSEGDGYEATDPADTVSLEAALLFIDRSGLHGVTARALWKACIVEANERKLKAREVMPADATAALRDYQAGMQGGCKGRRKTAAQRIGAAAVEICVERLTIKEHNLAMASN